MKKDDATLIVGGAEVSAPLSSPTETDETESEILDAFGAFSSKTETEGIDDTGSDFSADFGIKPSKTKNEGITIHPRLYDENVITLMFGDVSVRLKVPSMDANVIADEFLKKFSISQRTRHGKTGYVIMQRLFSDDEFISDKERAIAIKAATVALKKQKNSFISEQKKATMMYRALPPEQVGSRLLQAMLSATPAKDNTGFAPAPMNDIDKLLLLAIAVRSGEYLRTTKNKEGDDAVKPYHVKTLGKGKEVGTLNIFPVALSMEFITSRVIDIFADHSKHHGTQININECRKTLWESVKHLTGPFSVIIGNDNGKRTKRFTRFLTPADGSKDHYLPSCLFFYLSQYYDIIDFRKVCEGVQKFGGQYIDLRLALGAAKPTLDRTPLTLPIKYDEDASRKAKFDQRKRIGKIISKIDPTLQVQTDKKNVIISKKNDDKKDDQDNADTEKKDGE